MRSYYYYFHISVIIVLSILIDVYAEICSFRDQDGNEASMYCMKDCCGSVTKRYCCGPKRLDAGSLVGIVVGSIVGFLLTVALVTLCIYYCYIRTRVRGQKVITTDLTDSCPDRTQNETERTHLHATRLPSIHLASANYELAKVPSTTGAIVTVHNSGNDVNVNRHHSFSSQSGALKKPPSYDEIYQQKQSELT